MIALMVSLILAFPCFADSEITGQLKGTIDKVIKIVKDENLKNNKKGRRAALRKTIDERFNYRQMVMRSLAKNWDSRSDQEKQQFISLFKALLENSYASKLESYQDEKIDYLGETIKGEYALVKTAVVRPSSTIAVDYKLIQENGVWRVYDFIIEGVSMIRNYRSQFTKIIRKDSYEVLVQKLTDKINELERESKNSEDL